MNIFVWKLSKIAVQKKVFFLHFFHFEVPFNGLFAPTSRSRMSNIFRDLKFLGKRNGKKWSNNWTFLFESGLKSPRNFFFFFRFCLGPPSYGIGATIRIGRVMLGLPHAGFFINEVPHTALPFVNFWAWMEVKHWIYRISNIYSYSALRRDIIWISWWESFKNI